MMVTAMALLLITTTPVAFAQQSQKPEQLPDQSSTAADCSATMTHQSESAPHLNQANGPAQGCWTSRGEMVNENTDEHAVVNDENACLVQPLPGLEGRGEGEDPNIRGSANFSCGSPSPN